MDAKRKIKRVEIITLSSLKRKRLSQYGLPCYDPAVHSRVEGVQTQCQRKPTGR